MDALPVASSSGSVNAFLESEDVALVSMPGQRPPVFLRLPTLAYFQQRRGGLGRGEDHHETGQPGDGGILNQLDSPTTGGAQASPVVLCPRTIKNRASQSEGDQKARGVVDGTSRFIADIR